MIDYYPPKCKHPYTYISKIKMNGNNTFNNKHNSETKSQLTSVHMMIWEVIKIWIFPSIVRFRMDLKLPLLWMYRIIRGQKVTTAYYHVTFLKFQGVLMFKDQYRAVMQYSLPRDSGKPGDTGSPRSIHHDWICAKVGLAVLLHP